MLQILNIALSPIKPFKNLKVIGISLYASAALPPFFKFRCCRLTIAQDLPAFQCTCSRSSLFSYRSTVVELCSGFRLLR